LDHVAATIFTEPEIATVGVSQASVDAGEVEAETVKLALATNARAKMQGFRDGFVKLFARPRSGTIVGGVVVAPRASELILAVSLAVEQMLPGAQLAPPFAVYPSLSGTLTEPARKLMRPVKPPRYRRPANAAVPSSPPPLAPPRSPAVAGAAPLTRRG